MRSEGTPIPIPNPETPSMNPPYTSPKSPNFPQRHSSVRLPEGTRPTEASFAGPLRPPQEPAAEPRPPALLLDSVHAHPYPDIWLPQDNPPKHTPIPPLSSPKSPPDPHSEAPSNWTPSPCGTLTCTPLSSEIPTPLLPAPPTASLTRPSLTPPPDTLGDAHSGGPWAHARLRPRDGRQVTHPQGAQGLAEMSSAGTSMGTRVDGTPGGERQLCSRTHGPEGVMV